MKNYNLINVGSHVNPPPNMWVKHFPADLKHLAPVHTTQQFEGDGEYEVLMLEGIAYRMLESQIGVQTDPAILRERGVPFARSFFEGPDGQRNPAARIADQDLDGVDADVCVHPGFPPLMPKDMSTRWGLTYAFNSWLGEFCSYDLSRLIGVAELPIWDIDLAIREAHRIAKMGLKGVLMPAVPGYVGSWSVPAKHDYTHPSYIPLWQTLNELGLVMVVHADAIAATEGLRGYENPAINMIVNKTAAQEMIASLIVGNIFYDYPNLKLLCVETGVGWMAHLVSWMSIMMDEEGFNFNFKHLKEHPKDTFHKHVFGSFLWDTMGVMAKDIIGTDNIMWCNDYPHSYGPWPRSIDRLERDIKGISDQDRSKIMAGNAVKLFGL